MSKLSKYILENRKEAYDFALQNTPIDDAGRPIILKDDEWLTETEWDEAVDDNNNEC